MYTQCQVNAADDHGLIVSNWSGRYKDGTAPPLWTGTVPILREFVESGYQPVKYGQCWVFAAIATTRTYIRTTVRVRMSYGLPLASVHTTVGYIVTETAVYQDEQIISRSRCSWFGGGEVDRLRGYVVDEPPPTPIIAMTPTTVSLCLSVCLSVFANIGAFLAFDRGQHCKSVGPRYIF